MRVCGGVGVWITMAAVLQRGTSIQTMKPRSGTSVGLAWGPTEPTKALRQVMGTLCHLWKLEGCLGFKGWSPANQWVAVGARYQREGPCFPGGLK